MAFDEKQLRGFLAAADLGSIGRAAVLMNMSQPTLSRLIKGLEDRHRVRLFERLPTGIVLTGAGNALLPHARHLLFEMEQAADTLSAIRGLKVGVVRIGASPAVVRTIVAPAIARLRTHNPGLHVEVLEAIDNRLVDALNSYAIDLMIGSEVEASEGLRQVGDVLFEDAFKVCCATEHFSALESPPTIADVLPGAWAMPPRGSTPRAIFEEIVRNHGLPRPNVVIEAVSPNVLINSVISSGVFAWLAGLASNDLYAKQVTTLDLPPFSVTRRFFVYRRAQGILSGAGEQFLKMLQLPALPPGDASPAAV